MRYAKLLSPVQQTRDDVLIIALTFRNFVPRLELLALLWDFLGIKGFLRDFQKSMKMCKMNYFSLFWKSYLVLFLTFITALRFYAAPLVQEAGMRTNSFDLVKFREKIHGNLGKISKNLHKILENLSKRPKI